MKVLFFIPSLDCTSELSFLFSPNIKHIFILFQIPKKGTLVQLQKTDL